MRSFPTLTAPSVPATLIAARVPEIASGVAQDLAIASEQADARPSLRQRLAAKLRGFVAPDVAPSPSYDTAGYYPVRRVSGRAPGAALNA